MALFSGDLARVIPLAAAVTGSGPAECTVNLPAGVDAFRVVWVPEIDAVWVVARSGWVGLALWDTGALVVTHSLGSPVVDVREPEPAPDNGSGNSPIDNQPTLLLASGAIVALGLDAFALAVMAEYQRGDAALARRLTAPRHPLWSAYAAGSGAHGLLGVAPEGSEADRSTPFEVICLPPSGSGGLLSAALGVSQTLYLTETMTAFDHSAARPGCEWLEVNEPVVAVAAGHSHAVLVTESGAALTYGLGSGGQLGHGSTQSLAAPTQVSSLAKRRVVGTAAGRDHTLFVTDLGDVYATGQGQQGQLGTKRCSDTSIPAYVEGCAKVSRVAAGDGFSLAVTRSGSLWAWGVNTTGQLGLGHRGLTRQPAEVKGLPLIVAAAAGFSHTLLLDVSGGVWASGLSADGQLGLGDTKSSATFLPVRLPGRAVAIAAGSLSSYAVLATGEAYAWGRSENGRLGTGDVTNRCRPTRLADIPDELAVKAVFAGHARLLIVTEPRPGRGAADEAPKPKPPQARALSRAGASPAAASAPPTVQVASPFVRRGDLSRLEELRLYLSGTPAHTPADWDALHRLSSEVLPDVHDSARAAGVALMVSGLGLCGDAGEGQDSTAEMAYAVREIERSRPYFACVVTGECGPKARVYACPAAPWAVSAQDRSLCELEAQYFLLHDRFVPPHPDLPAQHPRNDLGRKSWFYAFKEDHSRMSAAELYDRQNHPSEAVAARDGLVARVAAAHTVPAPYDSPQDLAELVRSDLTHALSSLSSSRAAGPPPTSTSALALRSALDAVVSTPSHRARVAWVREALADASPTPIIVAGPAGSGKTVLAAETVSFTLASGLIVAAVCLDGRPGLWKLGDVVRELAGSLAAGGAKLQGEDDDAEGDDGDHGALIRLVSRTSAAAAGRRHVAIVIDGAERLGVSRRGDLADSLAWVPARLPDGVRLLITTSSAVVPELSVSRAWCTLSFPAASFSVRDARALISALARAKADGEVSGDSFYPDIGDHDGGDAPRLLSALRARLVATLATEGSLSISNSTCLADLCNPAVCPDDAAHLYEAVLAQMPGELGGEDAGYPVAAALLGSLLFSRRPLTEYELLQTVGHCPSRWRVALDAYLRHCSDLIVKYDEGGCMSFVSPLVAEVAARVHARWEEPREAHRRLAMWLRTKRPTAQIDSDLAEHLATAGDHNELEALVTDFGVFSRLNVDEGGGAAVLDRVWKECLPIPDVDLARQRAEEILDRPIEVVAAAAVAPTAAGKKSAKDSAKEAQALADAERARRADYEAAIAAVPSKTLHASEVYLAAALARAGLGALPEADPALELPVPPKPKPQPAASSTAAAEAGGGGAAAAKSKKPPAPPGAGGSPKASASASAKPLTGKAKELAEAEARRLAAEAKAEADRLAELAARPPREWQAPASALALAQASRDLLAVAKFAVRCGERQFAVRVLRHAQPWADMRGCMWCLDSGSAAHHRELLELMASLIGQLEAERVAAEAAAAAAKAAEAAGPGKKAAQQRPPSEPAPPGGEGAGRSRLAADWALLKVALPTLQDPPAPLAAGGGARPSAVARARAYLAAKASAELEQGADAAARKEKPKTPSKAGEKPSAQAQSEVDLLVAGLTSSLSASGQTIDSKISALCLLGIFTRSEQPLRDALALLVSDPLDALRCLELPAALTELATQLKAREAEKKAEEKKDAGAKKEPSAAAAGKKKGGEEPPAPEPVARPIEKDSLGRPLPPRPAAAPAPLVPALGHLDLPYTLSRAMALAGIDLFSGVPAPPPVEVAATGKASAGKKVGDKQADEAGAATAALLDPKRPSFIVGMAAIWAARLQGNQEATNASERALFAAVVPPKTK